MIWANGLVRGETVKSAEQEALRVARLSQKNVTAPHTKRLGRNPLNPEER